MSKRVAQIMMEPQHVVTKLLSELEAKNGYPSHDARHLAENSQKIRLKMVDLGLDPDDTTPQEFYHALQVRFENDARRFAVELGDGLSDLNKASAMAVKLIKDNLDLPQQWTLKTKTAKQALKSNPPRKLMNYLGYRSADSMLKRENIYELLLASDRLESKLWHKNLMKFVSRLDQTDFEMRPVNLIVLNESKWGDAQPPAGYVSYNSLGGAAALWPAMELSTAPLLLKILLLVESFTPKVNLKHGIHLVKMNLVLWWADTDHLIAETGDEHISLNIKDCAFNSWLKNDFTDRFTEHGRKQFWQELISRYPNRPAIEESTQQKMEDIMAKLRVAIPQPEFEFAEEFDG